MSYHGLVTTLVNVGDILSAFEYAERVKARTLSDMIETTMLTRIDIIPPSLQTASSAYRALTTVQSMAFDPLLSTLSPTQRAMVTHSNQQCLEQYGAVLADLKRDHPQLGRTVSLTFAQSSEQLNDVRAQLESGAVVLEYLVMRDEILLWVVTQDGVQTASKIAITRDELTEQVRGFREEIEDQPAPEQAAVSYKSALEKGRDLYELLIAPVENYLQGATHLVIVPSDVLFYLPFGALVHCPGCEERDLYGGEFLIERYSVSYAPSLSSLYWPFQHAGDGTYESVLAVGADPDPLYPLKYSAEEALAVSASFPHADLLLNQQCTEEEIKLKLQQKSYDVIHLSTHGRFDPILPLLSQVQFLPSAGEDGALHAGEILGLDLTGSLVVLSACQTALPPELTEESAGLVVGDEIQGLGQALFTAGASSVILTLWNVNDCSTSYLMEKMYQRLQDGAEKGEALRQAQLFLLGDPMYRHPCYWAPFVLYGDWR
jgi:CHAT domain-containing protein